MLLGLFVSIAPDGIPRLQQATLDLRVLVFTFGISLIAGILFGLAPAVRQPKPDLLAGKELHPAARNFLRPALITASDLRCRWFLLACAGLLLRSLWRLERRTAGHGYASVVAAQIDLVRISLPASKHNNWNFSGNLRCRLAKLPGVSALGLSDRLPPSGGMLGDVSSSIEVPGQPPFADGTGGMIGYRFVTPDYFSALGIRIVRGRAFRPDDLSLSNNPVVLSEALAKRILSGRRSRRKIGFFPKPVKPGVR